MDLPSRAGRVAHVLALVAFAVAQPTFDVLARHATFFAAHELTGGGLVLFAFLVVLLPTAVVVAVEELAGAMSRKLSYAVHLAAVGGLVALLAVPALERMAPALGETAVVGTASAVALGSVLAYATLAGARRLLSILALCAAAFPVLFLARGEIRALDAGGPAEGAALGIARPAPIVLVVFDGLRLVELLDESGGVDAERFPSFGRLAGTSTWYRNATTVAAFTNQAVPAILTGSYPPRGATRPPTPRSYPHSLFTLLGKTYDVRADEPVTRLCPETVCRDAASSSVLSRALRLASDTAIVWLHVVLPESRKEALPDLEGKWSDFGAAARKPPIFEKAMETVNRRDAFLKFIGGLEREREPALYFHHSMLPHNPFDYFPSGRSYALPARRVRQMEEGYDWPDDADAVRFEEGRYVLQLAYVDALLGRLLDRLDEIGMTDDTLLVVTADHGFAFTPGRSQRAPDDETFGDIVPVPLFIKTPGQREGRGSDEEVETVDILPTIAATIGAQIPWAVDGRAIGSSAPKPKSFLVNARLTRISSVADQRDEALRRKLASVGSGGSPYDVLYDSEVATPGAELAQLPRADAPAAYSVGIVERPQRGGKRPGPFFVHGRVTAPRPPARGDRVVIARDGRVVGVAPLFRSTLMTAFGFEALLDERAAACDDCEVEVLFWDSRGRVLREPASVARVAEDAVLAGSAADDAWRIVWTASDYSHACSREVRERFVRRMQGDAAESGALRPHFSLKHAVAECLDDAGGRDAAERDRRRLAALCTCGGYGPDGDHGGEAAGPTLAPSALKAGGAGAPARTQRGDERALWRDVWAESELEDACDEEVRRRFEALYREVRGAGDRWTIAPYAVLEAAVAACWMETGEDADSADATRAARACACGPFDRPQAHDGKAVDAGALRRRLLVDHLKRNGAL